MPVTVKKLPSGKVRVSTPNGVKAKGTTPKKAASQKRLLNAIDHGFKPTGRQPKKRLVGNNAQPKKWLGGRT